MTERQRKQYLLFKECFRASTCPLSRKRSGEFVKFWQHPLVNDWSKDNLTGTLSSTGCNIGWMRDTNVRRSHRCSTRNIWHVRQKHSRHVARTMVAVPLSSHTRQSPRRIKQVSYLETGCSWSRVGPHPSKYWSSGHSQKPDQGKLRVHRRERGTILSGTQKQQRHQQVRKKSANTYNRHTNNHRARVETVGPQIFRIGDIVEIQVSFIVVPLKHDKHKMIVVLRSIALLDPYFSQVKTENCLSQPYTHDASHSLGSIEMQDARARGNTASDFKTTSRLWTCHRRRGKPDGNRQAHRSASESVPVNRRHSTRIL